MVTPHREKASIVAVLPRGEAIKNFVYTRALDTLAESHAVSVISVLPNAELTQLLRDRYGDITELTDIGAPWLVRLQRELIDLAHGRYLWSEAAKFRWNVRDHEANTLPRRAKRVAKKAVAKPFANALGLELLSASDRVLSRALRPSDRWVDFMRERQPALVFNGSHIHNVPSTPIVRAAQWAGIPTAAFLFSWDNLTSQGRMMPTYDHYLVWNERIKADLQRIYPRVSADQITVTGTPQFDFHFQSQNFVSREEFCAQIGADPSRPIVLYSTGMASQMPEEPRIVEAVAEALGKVQGVPKPQLLVRVYPKDRSGRFDALKAKRLPDVLFPSISWIPEFLTPTYEDCLDLTNTLRHVHFGLNVASTVSLELCMFDKPVLNIGFDPPGVDVRPISYARYYSFDHYRPVVESGAVDVIYRVDDLVPSLQSAFDAPHKRAAGRAALLELFFGNTLDGKSATRVAAALEGIAGHA